MINKNQLNRLCIFILLIVVLANSVYGLGVAPARTLFNSGKSFETGKIRVLNNQHRDINVAVYATGEYKDFVKINQPKFSIGSEESSATITYELNVPPNLEPGRNIIEIIVLELPSGISGSNSVKTNSNEVISATTAVITQLLIDVPYPGKFLVSNLRVNSANADDTITFTASLFGKGSENIDNIEGTAIIKGPTNQEITRLQSNEISLASGEDGKIVANWKADVNPGTYYVEMVINYDGKQIVLSNQFMVGDKNLKVKELIIDKFKIGQIAKVDIIAESVWNDDIDNVYAELNVLDSTGSTIQTVKTSSETVPSLGTTVLSGYWDTKGISIGNYDINVRLSYDEKTSEKLFSAAVNANNIQISDLARIGGQVVGEGAEKTGSNLTTLLIVAVIVLIVINLVWLLKFKKPKKKKLN